MKKDTKRKIAYEILIFLMLMALLLLVLRMWPILLLFVLGIFAAALRLLFLSTKNVEVIEPAKPIEEKPVKPETEHDLKRHAFGILQHRISEEVTLHYPNARWVWEIPFAFESFSEDEPVSILLNGAGGYRKAFVTIHNLQFLSLEFIRIKPEKEAGVEENKSQDNAYSATISEADNSESFKEVSVNYELLAFEWIEENMASLNEQCNEAIAQKDESLLIPDTDLPVKGSWAAIREQLLKNGFTLVMETDEGLKVNIPQ